MKIIAIILNVILLVWVIYNLTQFGSPSDADIFIAILLFLTPLCNLYVIYRAKGSDWLSLFMKRKALEEKKKIDNLETH